MKCKKDFQVFNDFSYFYSSLLLAYLTSPVLFAKIQKEAGNADIRDVNVSDTDRSPSELPAIPGFIF